MKYLRTILKSSLVLIAVLGVSGADAQNKYLKNAVYLNGGNFSGSPTASIGGYDPYQESYEHFDSLYVSSVQDIAIDSVNGDRAYLAAQDTLLFYDLENQDRVRRRPLTQLKWLHATKDHLFAGRFNYPGVPAPEPFMEAYITLSLGDPGFDLDSFHDNTNDMAVINDTAYVSHNLENSSGSDSVGYLAVFDLNNQEFVEHIDLGTQGAGINEVYTHQGKIYGLTRKNSNLVEYNPANGNLSQNNIGVSEGFGLYNGVLYARFFEDHIGTFDVANNEFVDSALFTLDQPNNFSTAAYDTLTNQFFVAETNYATYGAGYVYNDTGKRLDSFATNVSPTAIAFQYAINEAPIAATDYDTVEAGETESVGVLANDEDPEAHDLTLSGIAIQGSHGTATIDGDSVYYTADSSYVGNDTVHYEVCDEIGNCDTGMIVFNVEEPSTGLDLVAENPAVEVYPNPVKDQLNVQLANSASKVKTQFQLQNLQGKVLMTKAMPANQTKQATLDLGHLESGVYILQITTGDSVAVQRIVKQ